MIYAIMITWTNNSHLDRYDWQQNINKWTIIELVVGTATVFFTLLRDCFEKVIYWNEISVCCHTSYFFFHGLVLKISFVVKGFMDGHGRKVPWTSIC